MPLWLTESWRTSWRGGDWGTFGRSRRGRGHHYLLRILWHQESKLTKTSLYVSLSKSSAKMTHEAPHGEGFIIYSYLWHQESKLTKASLLPSFNGPLSIKIWNQVSCNLFYFVDRKCMSDTLLIILESLHRKCLDRQGGYFSGSTLSKWLPPDISRYWTRDVSLVMWALS